MKIDKFNKKAAEWLQDLERYSHDEIHIKPDENSWSLAELYDHVIRVARAYQIPNINECVSAGSATGKSKTLFGHVVFTFNFIPRIRISMSSFPKELEIAFTPTIREKEELLADFKYFIKEVNLLGKELKSKNNPMYLRHPMFGDLSTKDWFSVIEIHLRHHDRQKRRIIKSVLA